MLHFSIFHVFFSHQHVQMITGPHEKKWCGKIFWGPFLNKMNFFRFLTMASAENVLLYEKITYAKSQLSILKIYTAP